MTWNNIPAKDWQQMALDSQGGPRTRSNDYSTSIEGARAVSMRAGSQKARLLAAFDMYEASGLTDEEAAVQSGVTGCFWKRCGELRALGMIEFNGQKRIGEAGVQRLVSVITPYGIKIAREIRK